MQNRTTEIVSRPKKESLALECRQRVKMLLRGIDGSMTVLSRCRDRQKGAVIDSTCFMCDVVRSLWSSGGCYRRGQGIFGGMKTSPMPLRTDKSGLELEET